ncbi:TBL2 family protein [Megaselia abdita]
MENIVYLAIFTLIAAISIFAVIFYRKKTSKDDTQQRNCSKGSQKENKSGQKENVVSDFSLNHNQKSSHHKSKGNKQSSGGSTKRNEKNSFSHPWLASTLKGHTDDIRDIDFSSNGKYLASCGEDRTILVWPTSQLQESKDRKYFRFNSEYDFGTKISWSPDSKALAINKSLENVVEVYKLERKDSWFSSASKALTFPHVTHADILGFGIACTGRYIMTCSNKTDLFIWNLKGNILEKIDTCLMNNYSAKLSPCGRFIAVCGFSPDCKVYEVKFSRTGEYQKTVKVFDLCGHNSGIYDVAFDQDSSHVVTISKDGTWKLYDTKIEYDKGQSPKCLKTGQYTQKGTIPIIALSPTAEVLAVANADRIELYNMFSGDLDATIKNITCSAISFDPIGKLLLAASGKHIFIFNNITGYKAAVGFAELKLKSSGSKLTSATQERLENSIKEWNEIILKNEL